jgi:hypothetical protein
LLYSAIVSYVSLLYLCEMSICSLHKLIYSPSMAIIYIVYMEYINGREIHSTPFTIIIATIYRFNGGSNICDTIYDRGINSGQ